MSSSNKKANRLFLAFKDMQDTSRYLRAYVELEQLEDARDISKFASHREAILIAAIVTYCRPFKYSRSDGKADNLIKPEEIGLFAGKESFGQLHTALLNLRDKAVAHGDWDYHTTELVEATESSVQRRSPRPFYGQGVSIPEFVRLVKHVRVNCLNMAFDLDRKGGSTAAP